MFQVGVSSVLQKFTCGKRLLRSKKDCHGQILVNYSCHGWMFLCLGECVLGKTPKGCFLWYLEYGYGWFLNGFLSLYSSKRWQSVSWYNLHKEHSRVNGFLNKKQFLWTILLYMTQIPVKNLCTTYLTSDR